MNHLEEQYTELLALTKLYLLQEHSSTERIPAESDTFLYFKQIAIETKQKQAPLSKAPVATPQEPIQPKQVSSHSVPPAVPKPPPSPAAASKPPIVAEKIAKPERPALPMNEVDHSKLRASTETKGPYTFTLEPVKEISQIDIGDLKKIALERWSGFQFLETIPSETKIAQTIQKQENLPHVLIFFFEQNSKSKAFLFNLAQALELYGIATQMLSATQIENENRWDQILELQTLRLCLLDIHSLSKLPQLEKHYKSSKEAKHFVGKVPLLPLSDITVYMKEPALKASLWKAICELLVIA